MATYSELYSVISSASFQTLKNKIVVAVAVSADTIRQEDPGTTNHANRLLWAKQVFESPVSMAESVVWAIISANSAATVSQILNASDSTIQTNVNNVIDLFAIGA